MARKLTAEDKAARARQRKIDTARQYSTGTYVDRYVAPVFQRMIRAEAGARPPSGSPAMVNGVCQYVVRVVGECVCVTCGKVRPWTTAAGEMQTGHFLPSRRLSILFEEANVAPQCVWCNQHRGGALEDYRLWMETVRGTKVIERLTRLKATTIRQVTREELVDMRIGYEARLKAAEQRMNPNTEEFKWHF